MSEPNAVIQAVYADFKLIKTRSCLQLVFEVPVERATEALAIFGVPNHLTAIHVAIARLQAPVKEVMPHSADPRSEQRAHKALPHSSGGGAPIYHDPIGPPRLRDEPRETRPETEEPTRKVDATRVQSGTIPATAVEAAHLSAKFAANRSERAKASYRMSDDGERAVTRAAMLCKDPKFQEWLLRRREGAVYPSDNPRAWTSQYLRDELGITTRGEIATDERAYAAFLALEAEYKLATGQMAELR